MVIGWRWQPLKRGERISVYDKTEDSYHTCPAIVLAETTREQYETQQAERGLLAREREIPWSVVNTATQFYLVSID